MATNVHGTLTASTVATATIGGRGAIRVINRGGAGADDLYCSFDGSAPTVEGDFKVVGIGGSRDEHVADKDGTIVVKLISAGTPKYTVELIGEVFQGS